MGEAQTQDSSPQALAAPVLPSSTPRTGCQVECGIAGALGLEPTWARMGQEVGGGVSWISVRADEDQLQVQRAWDSPGG